MSLKICTSCKQEKRHVLSHYSKKRCVSADGVVYFREVPLYQDETGDLWNHNICRACMRKMQNETNKKATRERRIFLDNLKNKGVKNYE